jgi:hypothetical protein
LKKYWPFIALFVAIGAILYLTMALDRENDEVIANLMADRTMAKHRADRDAIIAKYAKLNAAKDQELTTWRQGNKVLAAKIIEKQKALNVTVTTLAEAEAKYNRLDEYLGYVSDSFMERIAAGDRMYSETLAIKDAEIAEWRAKDEANTRTIGVLTKQIVMLTLSRQKRLVVGPQVGYGLQGYHVGFGITWELFRFKAPGQ